MVALLPSVPVDSPVVMFHDILVGETQNGIRRERVNLRRLFSVRGSVCAILSTAKRIKIPTPRASLRRLVSSLCFDKMCETMNDLTQITLVLKIFI